VQEPPADLDAASLIAALRSDYRLAIEDGSIVDIALRTAV
jgi:hypothetical protein